MLVASVVVFRRLFFFSVYCDHRDLHSFPTRRSSDLVDRQDDDARESQSLFGISAARCAEDSFVEFGQGDNADRQLRRDRKSTRLNSSHVAISYAVFCLKKKNIKYLAH